MALEPLAMAELSEINRKLDVVLDSLSNLRTGQALADQNIEALQARCSRFEGQLESLAREVRHIEQQNTKVEFLKRDIDHLGSMVRDLEEDIKLSIDAALQTALEPFRAYQSANTFKWSTVSVVGKGGWALLLLAAGIALGKLVGA